MAPSADSGCCNRQLLQHAARRRRRQFYLLRRRTAGGAGRRISCRRAEATTPARPTDRPTDRSAGRPSALNTIRHRHVGLGETLAPTRRQRGLLPRRARDTGCDVNTNERRRPPTDSIALLLLRLLLLLITNAPSINYAACCRRRIGRRAVATRFTGVRASVRPSVCPAVALFKLR